MEAQSVVGAVFWSDRRMSAFPMIYTVVNNESADLGDNARKRGGEGRVLKRASLLSVTDNRQMESQSQGREA